MKYTNILTLTLLAIGLVACSSSAERSSESSATMVDCVFPDGSNEPAPGWVCDEPVDGVALSAVGSAEPTNAGSSFQKSQAAADARGKLAEQFQVQVDKMVKSYLGTTGAGDAETIDRVAQSVLKTVSSNTLYGSKVIRSRQGPDGSMYVLVAIDETNTRAAAATAVETSMNNDNALWQQFQAQQGFDELRQEIASQPIE